MNRINFALAIVIFIFILTSCKPTSKLEEPPRVNMITEYGEIVIEIETGNAPVTASNFLRYVKENRFEEAYFYRVVTPNNQPNDSFKIEVIQGGLGFTESDCRLSPIKHETTQQTGLQHKDGVISMARLEPGSASSEFFICIGDQPELDYSGKRNPDGKGFAAFGRVVKGMEVVRKIHKLNETGQMLDKPVMISNIAIATD